ncbi:unnamed protein product [Orchesella dallaii]|uniref:BTB domain-containing protein n=1 Tax=Orchesella dallaii TaxID=48710 RepID=A0ABP1PUD6_9HEXA
METHESIGQELVKCVLVGDTAVGKTRLICARACNSRVSLRQLLRQHVPTVWAIDQYRIYKEVLERSMTTVDGVQVSLRLWDTFGDHEKDRRFAYGRSDVILLCFSLGNRNSLLHCKSMWFPEIRRFCPETPVILVGCKNDLRFLCRDPTYLAYCRPSPFIRPTRECDLVMPEQARAMAKELGISYYESSVLTYHGVNNVFENAIRAALICRRNQRFWMTNLKHIQQPLLQAPYCPPKKELSTIEVFPGTYWADMKTMLASQCFPDLVFVIGEFEINAHRFLVSAGAPEFLWFLEAETYTACRRNSEASETTSESTADETEWLLKTQTPVDTTGFVNELFSCSSEFDWCPERTQTNNNCDIIEHVTTRAASDSLGKVQVVVHFSDKISYDTIRSHIHFLYTGELPQNVTSTIEELKEMAEMLKTPVFSDYVDVWHRCDNRQMVELKKAYRQYLKTSLWSKCTEGLSTDVMFHMDDGKVPAHRALLMARSDVMRAMFSGDFRERRSQSVSLPGVKRDTFLCFLEYLYTDSVCPHVPVDIGVSVIELANRLCLTRLINLLESTLINVFAQKQAHGIDVVEDCIKILESAQLHNAEQLAQWCLLHLATNYDFVCRKHNKIFKELGVENRQWISQNRWPPIWYVKDFDYYQKALMERYKMDNPAKKSRKRNNSGCLCFPGKSRRDDQEDRNKEIMPVVPQS